MSSHNIKLRPGGLAFLMLVALGASPAVQAAETAVGTTISNTASAAFNVAGVAQTPKTGNTSFTVDRKINLTLVDANTAYNSTQTSSPAPGSSNAVLKYTLTNTGNGTQDFHVSATDAGADPYGGTDNYDQAISVFVDGNGNGTYEVANDTATFVDELAQNASISVFLVGNIALARADGDISVKTLTAQAEVGGTAASEGAAVVANNGSGDTQTQVSGSEDVVFADSTGNGGDAARDGTVARLDAFKVVGAQITVTKSSQVISDPFNLLVNPKRIPGATIRYTITVANGATAGSSATAVTVSDTVDASTTYTSPSITVDAGATGTDASDGVDASGFDVRQAAGVVTVLLGTMAANTTHTITFDVTVN